MAEESSLFERAETYAQKADIARYEVVHRFGGVYVDTDMESLRPLDGLLNDCEFFAARQHDGVVAIGIFGGAASHPILSDVIRRLPVSCFVYRNGPIPIQTGPNLLNRAIEDGAWRDAKACAFSLKSTLPHGPLERWAGRQDVLGPSPFITGTTAGETGEPWLHTFPNSFLGGPNLSARTSLPYGARDEVA